VQSSSQIITTNKPTSSFFTGLMPFLWPNQQCQSTEWKISHSMDLLACLRGAGAYCGCHPPTTCWYWILAMVDGAAELAAGGAGAGFRQTLTSCSCKVKPPMANCVPTWCHSNPLCMVFLSHISSVAPSMGRLKIGDSQLENSNWKTVSNMAGNSH